MKIHFIILVITILSCGINAQQKQVEIVSIHETSVEYLENPEGINTQRPRLSWVLKGKARVLCHNTGKIGIPNSK